MLRTVKRLAWVSLGAIVALGLALLATKPPTTALLLASLGGSTIFLFGLTGAPAAQPRALFGGHLISALIGIVCYQLFDDALWVYLLVVAQRGCQCEYGYARRGYVEQYPVVYEQHDHPA